nr:CRISPR-associated endonuclease Cas2 [Methanobrevibacter smithii]
MIKLKILVLFNLKFKKDILKLERILNYNAFKQISEKTYIGNLDNNEILILKEKISKIPDENGFIIIIPICGACYNKITYFGKEINLEEEKYEIL